MQIIIIGLNRYFHHLTNVSDFDQNPQNETLTPG